MWIWTPTTFSVNNFDSYDHKTYKTSQTKLDLTNSKWWYSLLNILYSSCKHLNVRIFQRVKFQHYEISVNKQITNAMKQQQQIEKLLENLLLLILDSCFPNILIHFLISNGTSDWYHIFPFSYLILYKKVKLAYTKLSPKH